MRIVRRGEGTPPYGCGTWRAVQTGRRGNRRSAAGGGRSEPVSRKCPDWRPRQWAGIGWHDGGQSPPPYGAQQEMRRMTSGTMWASSPTDELEGAVGNGRYFAHKNPALVGEPDFYSMDDYSSLGGFSLEIRVSRPIKPMTAAMMLRKKTTSAFLQTR